MSVPSPTVPGMVSNLLATPPGGRWDPWAPAGAATGTPVQLGLDDLGTPLSETTFVVVDLETTGCSPRTDRVTEIGAVKVRGGEVLGEFQTLVDPGGSVPPLITVLTGITDAMLIDAPRMEAVLPAFVEFARGAVVVAHNARFDLGFLRSAAERMGLPWTEPPVVDTVALARRVITRDDAPNHKLSSLAAFFNARVAPDHRALTDARATVDVLHGLLDRLGALGVTHLDDLLTAADPVPHVRRRKAGLADGLPSGPGVYQFLGPGEEVLYVGTASDIRRRVRSYFTAAEKRARMGEMLALATAVRPIACRTVLEAQVRELRLIAQHKPPYNRRSRRPEREAWLRLTDEPIPRLSVVASVGAVASIATLGPFASKGAAGSAMAALQVAEPIRRCTQRLPRDPSPDAAACVLAELGRCAAPCVHGAVEPSHSEAVEGIRRALTGDLGDVIDAVRDRIDTLAAAERFEEAAQVRDELAALLRAAIRGYRIRPLQGCRKLVAARRTDGGGWEIVLARFGRLAGTTLVTRGADPMPAVHALEACGEVVPAPIRAGGAASAEETDLIARWLDQPGTRLVDLDPHEGLAWPVSGPGTALAALRVISARGAA